MTARPAQPAPEPVPGAPVSAVDADATFAISDDIDVSVRVWISEPLEAPDGRGPVRVVLALADFNAKHLWVEESTYSGPIGTRNSDPIDLATEGVNAGLAKFLAAGILGETESHPYVREVTGPCHVRIQPKAGKAWGEVASRKDLDISVSMSK